jgi:hypothetical protein
MRRWGLTKTHYINYQSAAHAAKSHRAAAPRSLKWVLERRYVCEHFSKHVSAMAFSCVIKTIGMQKSGGRTRFKLD